MDSNHRSAAQRVGPTGSDSMNKIAGFMTRHHMAPLPRNFELVHEALTAGNAELARELAGLGPHPSQNALDQLGLRYRLPGHCGMTAERLEGEVLARVSRLRDQVSLSLIQKRTFVRAVETIVRAVKEDEGQSLAEFLAELDFLSASATDLIRAETLLGEEMEAGISAIAKAEAASQTAKTMMLKDRLTGLPNRAAFLNQLDAVYSEEASPSGYALVLVQIPDLTGLQHQYGDEAVMKILKRLSAIFRKTIKKNDRIARIDMGSFGFLFADVDANDAHAIAERLYEAAENNLVFATEHQTQHTGGLSLAIGHAQSDDAADPLKLLELASAAMHLAATNPRQPIIGHRSGSRQAA
ncbi:GGDEF domain-containing protein [Peteryoungia desertarenae]|uniref:GGDEF domain-containing protein n=1 Tax=Peteryoungia desertarenae TaxID=1813451 RepID=A0ABX6QNA5_9HYPH|nr:GGDEF domain-containing protein [Peteryoungia desertarenae]QLF70010.1 GGDEF domain-containing protein [Peteryoungia desertarenae]